jgi:hypothetical protein
VKRVGRVRKWKTEAAFLRLYRGEQLIGRLRIKGKGGRVVDDADSSGSHGTALFDVEK